MPLVVRWETRVLTSPSEAYLWRGKMETSGGCMEDDVTDEDEGDNEGEATLDALPSQAPATKGIHVRLT